MVDDRIGTVDQDDFARLFDRAMTFDGYAHVGGTTEAAERLASDIRSGWIESGFTWMEPDHLRAALFAECRMLRFGGTLPSQRHYAYLLALDAAANGPRGVTTTWSGLAHDDNQWFLPEDRPYIETFNSYKAADAPTRIDLSLLPEPWVGRLEAPIVLLNLNPGVAVDDPHWHGSEVLQEHIQKNLRQELVEWPFHYLRSDLEESPGGKWWRRCLKAFIDAAGGGEEGARRVAERVVAVEFAGYHSVSFEPLPITLPSQRWMFSLLTQKLGEGALFIGLRGERLWTIAIPELGASPRCRWANNVQRSSVSAKNIGEEIFATAVGLLR